MKRRSKYDLRILTLPGEVTEVIPNVLYLTDERGAFTLENLYDYGIEVVVTCRDSIPKSRLDKMAKFFRIQGIRHVYYSIPDRRSFDISQFFEPFNNLMKECEQREEPVLVHCWAGISRSVTLVLSYLILSRLKKPLRECLLFLKEKREISNPNPGFKSQLRKLTNPIPSTSTVPTSPIMEEPKEPKEMYRNIASVLFIPRGVIDNTGSYESSKAKIDEEKVKSAVLSNGLFFGLRTSRGGTKRVQFLSPLQPFFFDPEDPPTSDTSTESSDFSLETERSERYGIPHPSNVPELSKFRTEIFKKMNVLAPDPGFETHKKTGHYIESSEEEEEEEEEDVLSNSEEEEGFELSDNLEFVSFIIFNNRPQNAKFPSKKELLRHIQFAITNDKLYGRYSGISIAVTPNYLTCTIRTDILFCRPSRKLKICYFSFQIDGCGYDKFLEHIGKCEFAGPNDLGKGLENGLVLGQINEGGFEEFKSAHKNTSSFSRSPFTKNLEHYLWGKLQEDCTLLRRGILTDTYPFWKEDALTTYESIKESLKNHAKQKIWDIMDLNPNEKNVLFDIFRLTQEYLRELVLQHVIKPIDRLVDLLKIRFDEANESKKEDDVSILTELLDVCCRLEREEKRFLRIWKNVSIMLNRITKNFLNHQENFDRRLLEGEIVSLFGGRTGMVSDLMSFFQDLPIVQRWFEEDHEDGCLFDEFRSLLCKNAKEGFMELPLIDFLFVESEKYKKGSAFRCGLGMLGKGFEGSIVKLRRHLESKEKNVVTGMIVGVDCSRKLKKVHHLVVFFGSKAFRDFWESIEWAEEEYLEKLTREKKKELKE